jgi:hypothetical protein
VWAKPPVSTLGDALNVRGCGLSQIAQRAMRLSCIIVVICAHSVLICTFSGFMDDFAARDASHRA